MNDPSRPTQIWTRHLLGFFTLRKLRDAKSNVLPQLPKAIYRAIVSVENALGEIPIGVSGVRTRIRALLNTIKEINVTPATNERTQQHLESDIRLLAELLEPLGYTESHLFSPELLHQLRRLGRKLQVISWTMKQSMSPGENTHRFFSSRTENAGGEMNSFAEDFHLALDEFRVTALPMYSVSTMEAAMRPLGIISNSSCTLLSFLDWVHSHRQVMDYRFGRIRTVCRCYRRYRVRNRVRGSNPSAEPALRTYSFLHVGLLNGRGIENWLEIEAAATSTRGVVTFSPTNEGLVRGAAIDDDYPVLEGDLAQSMSDLATWIEDHNQLTPNNYRSVRFSSNVFTQSTPDKTILQHYARYVYSMFIPHSRPTEDPLGNRLYGNITQWKLRPFKISTLTDEDIRHEI